METRIRVIWTHAQMSLNMNQFVSDTKYSLFISSQQNGTVSAQGSLASAVLPVAVVMDSQSQASTWADEEAILMMSPLHDTNNDLIVLCTYNTEAFALKSVVEMLGKEIIKKKNTMKACNLLN